MRKKVRGQLLFALGLATLVMCAELFAQPSPPPQPDSGPGGSDYLHQSVTIRGPFWAEGHPEDDNFKYFLFEPALPTPASAPVVLFLHGFRALTPVTYLRWIEHIVRKGHTVVWVQYDDGNIFTFGFTENALATWRDALNGLTEPGHVLPEMDPGGVLKTAIVGHSLGGSLAVALAANAAAVENGIPRPLALVAIEPGGRALIPPVNQGLIDPGTKMVLVVGEEDRLVCTGTAKAIWEGTPQIPDQNRDFLLVLSDYTGSPALVADHLFPVTSSAREPLPVNSLDFYVTFKLSVAASNCAFRGTDCEVALGDGSDPQVSIGLWSDGTPVNPMQWVADPAGFTAGCEVLPTVQRLLRR